jgi:pyruvate/2-oxoglutarate/acetoin dehydrogenase E1 component
MNDAGSAATMNVSRLIAETMGQQMRCDDRVMLIGEDVGASGGTFGASRGLQREFGEWRVRDAPISEMGFVGMGVGMAMAGLRPIVEIMFVDFIGVCLDPIVNAAAKNRYMSGGAVGVPITFRAAAGCIGVAAQHSQCLWGMLAHIPGLRVVAPSNPADYRQMLGAAIRCDDPVFVLEHKDVYLRRCDSFAFGTDVRGEIRDDSLSGACVVRQGSDISLVALSTMVERAIEAADLLAGRGISAEVVDLRSVVPLDVGTVCSSVAKTSRLLVIDEDHRSFGLSAELTLRVLEEIGPTAVAAFGRLATADAPIPAALALEDAVLPRTSDIFSAAMDLLEKPLLH